MRYVLHEVIIAQTKTCYTEGMKSTAQSAAVFVALVGSYAWLSYSSLTYYSAQLAGGLILLYFLIRLARKKHLLPLSVSRAAPEFALVSASICLLIGSTGNIDSFFFPLTYLHVFFLTMTIRPSQAVFLSVGVILFHYGLMGAFTLANLSSLGSIALLLCIFLFAKRQYEEHIRKELVVEEQQEEISKQQSEAILFISTFLKPKLQTLLHLSDYPEANKEVIVRQIVIIQEAVEELLQFVHPVIKRIDHQKKE